MPKLPILKPREVATAIEKIGFFFVRQKGSHRMYAKDFRLVIVPFHPTDLKRSTLRHIVKQSGLTVSDFLRFL